MLCIPSTHKTPHAQKRWMMHDMGYIYPHPAQLTSLSMIPKHGSLKERLRSVHDASLVTNILICAKRLLHKAVARVLTHFTQILVPSRFMIPAAQQLVPTKNIHILPHFISQ